MLLPFVKEGLESGEKAVHTVDPRRRDEHLQWLASAGIDVHKNNQFELRDWGDSHLYGGLFNQGGAMIADHCLVARNGGTEMELSFSFNGLLANMFGMMFSKLIRDYLAAEAKNLKLRCESL